MFQSIALSRARLGGMLQETVEAYIETGDIEGAVAGILADRDKAAIRGDHPGEKYFPCDVQDITVSMFLLRQWEKELGVGPKDPDRAQEQEADAMRQMGG